MRDTSGPSISDDLALDPLLQAIDADIAWLEKKDPSEPMIFGDRQITRSDYITGLKNFANQGRLLSKENFLEWINDNYLFMEVYGDKEWGDVFITGYFAPKIEGSRIQTERFSQALYARPDDLLKLDIKKFLPDAVDSRPLRARVEGQSVLPYFSRDEIDGAGKLAGRNLELCWVDPIDAFFLQIQGSGTVVFDDQSEIKLIYAEKNGQRYESIGKFVKQHIAPEKVTMFSLERYLKGLNQADRQAIFNMNPSYVFFQPSDVGSVTYIGVPATGGRTIATDKRFFPKGALGFLVFDSSARFVLDQDVGGAILGGGRVDLFTGSGEEGKRLAGALQARGELYYLIPK